MRDLILSSLHRFPGPWHLLDAPRRARLHLPAAHLLVTDRAMLAFAPTRRAAEDSALALADFHAACRHLPVLPVILAPGLPAPQAPLPFPGAAPAIPCSPLFLRHLMADVAAFPPEPDFTIEAWLAAPYQPVPGLLRAAADLWATHGETALRIAGAARGDLARTQGAVAALANEARLSGRKQVIFVTGAPGAGKTLCGLHAAFAPDSGAAFLTANPTLMHVLRATLVRDARLRGLAPRAAAGRAAAVVQPLHAFRDAYAETGIPPERLLVIDEAQRCWNTAHAIRKTLNKPVRLRHSEPAHILEAIGRQPGASVLLCLLGGGQEIHDGEGGLAAWGAALQTHPAWHAAAPPGALVATDPRQRLPALPNLHLVSDLHLGDPVRAFGAPQLVPWVDAVLRNDPAAARALAARAFPVQLTRSLPAMRAALRAPPPGRHGLLASAGARRLRAEGLGGTLPHQDEDAVARWFLDCWPDIRSSDALEIAATEFAAQGLELDAAGLCWDLDLRHTGTAWAAHAFRATAWTRAMQGESHANKLNAYRVLLTRARRRLVIWVPLGDAHDPTRDPAQYDAVADFLRRCGARPLDEPGTAADTSPVREPALL